MELNKSLESQLKELGADEQIAIEAAVKAVDNSHSPYSNFKVGAALLLDNGELILGSNQENIAYPSGICAERAALFNYGSSGTISKIKALAIVAFNKEGEQSETCSPCGACRQVMIEYEELQKQPYKVIFSYNGEIKIAESSSYLLPFAFHF